MDENPFPEQFFINWGHSHAKFIKGLNKRDAVNRASDKRLSFKVFEEARLSCVKSTCDRAVAQGWFDNGFTVVARTKVRASCGRGIVLCRKGHPEANAELIDAPLYTRYKNKDREVRVHVFRGRAIAVAEKKRRKGFEQVNLRTRLIQSHENGWVFCTEGVQVPEFATQLAIKACAALGLDFGAADVIIKGNKAFLVEFNTAPALQGRTLTAYTKAFQEYLRDELGYTPTNRERRIGIRRRPGPNPRRRQRRKLRPTLQNRRQG